MDLHASESVGQQIESLRAEVLQANDLPFQGVLSEEVITRLLTEANVVWPSRIYTPVVTIRLFLWQCLSASTNCVAAVARFNTWRMAKGLSAVSSETGAYCQARAKLPESVLEGMARHAGQELDRQAAPKWLWHGRRVKSVDGTMVSTPDTPANQAAWPQSRNQKPGVGFPLVRVLVIFSLAVGTVLEMAIGPCRGKGQSELGLLRSLLPTFSAGDVLLADRLHCSWFTLATLKRQGADFVVRANASRRIDYRKGRRLGKRDRSVEWQKPRKPEWMDQEKYDAFPKTLEVRVLRVGVTVKGFRSRKIDIVTSLMDAEEFPKEEITKLYRQRWQAELDLRSLKVTLKMDVLRCKTPEMVRKELWAHMLAYNLTRTVMAQAAAKHKCKPRQISFTAALEHLREHRSCLATATPAIRQHMATQLLKLIAQHRVGDRPDRIEPRQRKRRPKPFPLLQEPRQKARNRMAKNTCN